MRTDINERGFEVNELGQAWVGLGFCGSILLFPAAPLLFTRGTKSSGNEIAEK